METKNENEKIKVKDNAFRKFLRVAFVEQWGLKFIALAFAAVIWLIFKIS